MDPQEEREYIKRSHDKSSFCMESYAKINLFLDVLERFEDGYHGISTLYSEVDLHDRLKFSLTRYPEIKLLSEDIGVRVRDNLVYQVGVFIQAKYSVPSGARIELHKNIPIAAGLGGGSSNAAATIIGLDRLWGLGLTTAEKHEIASRFGSDINFFIEGYQAIGSHRGEIIKPLKRTTLDIGNILLVNPNIRILSSEAYELVEITSPNNGLELLIKTKDPQYCYNKLEAGIFNKYPLLCEIKQILEENGAKKAMLSGSGATMIGFFDNRQTCNTVLNIFQERGYWTNITTTRRRRKK